MNWTTTLGLGFFLGMQHALEADHLAAVAALLGRNGRPGHAIVRGAVWGIGHSATLLLVVGACVVAGQDLPGVFTQRAETVVALILVALGCGVIWRLRQETDRPAAQGRALFVGMAHGLSGSAALLVLVLHGAGGLGRSLLFVAIFGVGSILGMAALSLLISWPLRVVGTLAGAQRLVLGCFGGASVAIGLWMLSGLAALPH